MTAKERLLERVRELSEEEAADTLRLLDERESRSVNEWGNLSTLADAAAGEAMRRLDAEERAQSGQTIAEAWGRDRAE